MTPACADKAAFGPVEAVGCLTRDGDTWTSSGLMLLNGIVFRPVGDARLSVDPDKRRIDSGRGEFTLEVGGTVIYRGTIGMLLTSLTGGRASVDPLKAPAGATVGAMPVAGNVEIVFDSLRALIKTPVRLPFIEALQRACAASCPAVTAETTIVTDNATGVQRRAWELGVRNVPLGFVRVENLDLALNPVGRRWTGTGKLVIASPTPLQVRADWVVDNGILQSATAHLNGVRTPISFGVLLRRLDLGVSTSPAALRGALAVEAGPIVAGQVPVALDGSFLYRIGGPGGNMLRADGQTRIMGFPAASGHLQLWSSGAFDFGLQLAVGLPNVAARDPRQEPVFVSAALAGWLARGGFSAEATAELLVLGQRAAAAELLVSSVGLAACGQLGWLRGGYGRRWTEPSGSVMAGACDVGPYRARRAAVAAQAGPLTLRLDDAPRGTLLRFRGNGGPPRVVLEGPGGQRVEAPADGTPLADDRFVVLQDPGNAVTHVAIRRPAGTWRVTTPADSPSVDGFDSADVLAPPRVSARVSGKGAKRVLRWRLRPLRGQRVTFAEEGSDSANVIARTTRARGKVRLTPSPGAGRARNVVAIVEQDGAPRDTLTVARYTAPAWRRPAKPRRLRVRRKGTTLIVTWRKAAGAERYTVFATAADGDREVFVLPRGRLRLRIPDVQRNHHARVEVAGLRSDNLPGPRSRIDVKPVRPRRD